MSGQGLVSLQWQDYMVLAAYLIGMLALGVAALRRQQSDADYFLGNRHMPPVIVGISIVTSLLSSLTYLAEPGEVWRSGITHVAGKLAGIPLGLLLVWTISIPFMMRFHFTSAYEYLDARFGPTCRRLGVSLFVLMMVLWMGFVVQTLSKVFHQLTAIPLGVVIFTVGLVATAYTVLGGLRAVVWTDVVQAVLLIAGALVTIGVVVSATHSDPIDWLNTARLHLHALGHRQALPWFSWDPTVRATVGTVAINMAVWQLCMHTSNQVTVQRYFSTRDVRSARRSLVVSGVFYAGITVLLVMVGLAVMHYYLSTGARLDGNLNAARQQDLIFPVFAVRHSVAGFGGAVLAGLMAAAMSSIDSGANSIATVLAVEWQTTFRNSTDGETVASSALVHRAMRITLLAGLAITATAYLLTFLPAKWGIVGAIPRTFNAVTGPLGGLFLLGIFVPAVRSGAAFTATLAGMASSIALGYLEQISNLLVRTGLCSTPWPELSFTWILPASLATTLLVGVLLIPFDPTAKHSRDGLTWFTRARR